MPLITLGVDLSSSGASRRGRPLISLLWVAAILLVLAQVVGIYGLVTRKADLVLSLLALGLLVASVLTAFWWAYHQVT